MSQEVPGGLRCVSRGLSGVSESTVRSQELLKELYGFQRDLMGVSAVSWRFM